MPGSSWLLTSQPPSPSPPVSPFSAIFSVRRAFNFDGVVGVLSPGLSSSNCGVGVWREAVVSGSGWHLVRMRVDVGPTPTCCDERFDGIFAVSGRSVFGACARSSTPSPAAPPAVASSPSSSSEMFWTSKWLSCSVDSSSDSDPSSPSAAMLNARSARCLPRSSSSFRCCVLFSPEVAVTLLEYRWTLVARRAAASSFLVARAARLRFLSSFIMAAFFSGSSSLSSARPNVLKVIWFVSLLVSCSPLASASSHRLF
mmetsp:Transcript_17308/g.40612  ORF Transcript_17308/g.40612 Transcript_17308/m.40612 type:complete len:256 (-) Transcript_17308:2384-3151(-)